VFLAFFDLWRLYESAPAKELVVNRQPLLADILDIYSTCDILDFCPKVSFAGESGDDFGGLTKELFTSFLKEAYQTFFHGENCKVPFLPLYRARKESSVFVAIGRLLSHQAAITRTVPCQMARSTYISLVFNEPADEDCLIGDLFLFVTEGERRVLRQALGNFASLSKPEMGALADFFAHHELHEVPKRQEIRQQVATIAGSLLVTKPEQFIKLMRSGIPQMHIDAFWSHINLFVCLLLNGTSGLFRPLVPRIVEIEHTNYVKNDLK